MIERAQVTSFSALVREQCHSSKKQARTTLSSSEAKYVATSSATCQAIWMCRIMRDFQQVQEKATEIFCDNKAAISKTN